MRPTHVTVHHTEGPQTMTASATAAAVKNIQSYHMANTDGRHGWDDIGYHFLIDGAEPENVNAYERVVLLFDGHDDAALTWARRCWKGLKDHGGHLTYWQQDAEGRWQKKAEAGPPS